MATQTIRLTPHTDPTPAVVEVERELSGVQWCARFPRSKSIATLRPTFQLAVSNFLWALENAGATYRIANTFRPKEACYLMNSAWRIWQGRVKPEAVPEMPGVHIKWVHGTKERSIGAAYEMCVEYQITQLEDAPALESNHTKGLAIDVSISWYGTLTIKDGNEQDVVIDSLPRNNMNRALWDLGASYGVLRYYRPGKDRPHWSADGK